MSQLAKLAGVLSISEDGRPIWKTPKRWDCDFERFCVMTTSPDKLLACLRHVSPGDLRVFFAVVRRIDHRKGYALYADYKRIARDLEVTPTVVFKSFKRLMSNDKTDALIRTYTLPHSAAEDADETVTVVHPDIVYAGLHKRSRSLWELAGRAEALAREEADAARRKAEEDAYWAKYKRESDALEEAEDAATTARLLDILADAGISPTDAEYHLAKWHHTTGNQRLEKAA